MHADFVVNGEDLCCLVLPCEMMQRVGCFGAKLHGEWLLAEDGHDAIGKFFDVPEVDVECVRHDFAHAGLLREDDRSAMGDGFECHETEGFRGRRHDEAACTLVELPRLGTAHFPREDRRLL